MHKTDLSPAQRHQILVEWNDTRQNDHFKIGLQHLVRTCALRHGKALAVDDGHQSLTLGEVVRLASGLAARLRCIGVGREDVVALSIEPSCALPWAAMGILETGACCLPLDPTDPQEHRTAVLADASPQVVLYADSCAPESSLGPWRLFDVGTVEPALSPPPLPDPEFSPDHLAYVVYPPPGADPAIGMELPHRVFTSLALGRRRLLGLHPGVRIRQAAAPGTIDSVVEMWTALISASCLDMRPGRRHGSTRNLTEFAGIPFFSRTGLETTTPLDSGRPPAGTRRYLLDHGLGIMAPGSVSEIYTAGLTLGRGFRGRPARTAECFIPHPFCERVNEHEGMTTAHGDRLYRTGSYGVYHQDGTLEILRQERTDPPQDRPRR